MDINKAFPSKYLRACDLNDQDQVMEIAVVQLEDVGDEQKPVVYFHGWEQGLVLNKTNANTIVDLHGHETDNWPTKKIALFPTQTEYGGKQVECIRVRIKAPTGAPSEVPF